LLLFTSSGYKKFNIFRVEKHFKIYFFCTHYENLKYTGNSIVFNLQLSRIIKKNKKNTHCRYNSKILIKNRRKIPLTHIHGLSLSFILKLIPLTHIHGLSLSFILKLIPLSHIHGLSLSCILKLIPLTHIHGLSLSFIFKLIFLTHIHGLSLSFILKLIFLTHIHGLSLSCILFYRGGLPKIIFSHGTRDAEVWPSSSHPTTEGIRHYQHTKVSFSLGKNIKGTSC
jgi:flagellar biosynthesis protein FliQ